MTFADSAKGAAMMVRNCDDGGCVEMWQANLIVADSNQHSYCSWQFIHWWVLGR